MNRTEFEAVKELAFPRAQPVCLSRVGVGEPSVDVLGEAPDRGEDHLLQRRRA